MDIIMVLSFRKIVLYDVKLLAMGHVTTIVSTVPSYGQVCVSLYNRFVALAGLRMDTYLIY